MRRAGIIEPESFPDLRSRLVWALLLLAGFLAQPANCFAWSGAGHMIAAELAYRQLTPEQQWQAVEILRNLPSFDYDIGPATDQLPPDEQAVRIFMLASIWPDLIKNEKHPAHAESRPEWHVTWLPLVAAGYRLPAKLSKAGNKNTMEALPVLMQDFATSSALALQERAVHLAWILHLVGDLHQPLHAVALYSSQWPAGDNSGSSFYVRARAGEEPMPLHKVWDSLFGFRDVPTTELLELGDSITTDPLLARDQLATELLRTTPRQWIEESRDVARREAYLLDTTAPLQGLPMRQAQQAAATGGHVPTLPAGYVPHARTVARKQVVLAGDRLADYLDGCL